MVHASVGHAGSRLTTYCLRLYMGLNPSGAVVLQLNVTFDDTAQR